MNFDIERLINKNNKKYTSFSIQIHSYVDKINIKAFSLSFFFSHSRYFHLVATVKSLSKDVETQHCLILLKK